MRYFRITLLFKLKNCEQVTVLVIINKFLVAGDSKHKSHDTSQSEKNDY